MLRPGDHFNSLLGVHSLDVHRDTPVELLHTYLLGQDKYVWHATHSAWASQKDEKNLKTFHIRLASSSIDGLTLASHNADYICQYKNALTGKHFKVLQQLGVFHLHGGLCSEPLFDLWKATGELGAMLWFHTISDIKQYLVSYCHFLNYSRVDILILNFLGRS